MLCLTVASDARWAQAAAANLPALLADHAHCEMKAASNALSLATRWPAVAPDAASLPIARALIRIAEEELAHFREVLAELERRGLPLGKPDVDTYAAELRAVVNRRPAKTARGKVVDRLLVGALIEARSCERFRLLADALGARGHELASFYERLFADEARHYTTLVNLAEQATDEPARVRTRLVELAAAEGAIVASLPMRATMHG